ncbi:MAG: 30S ribosomal protein S6--L-glutamate ligase [Bacteroidia bacterium]|nr:30S ribosomal protein S6--L-glutamate ligase [Bacteroidia bacterium]
MKIVILSKGKKLYSTKRLVEACEKQGHHPIVIDHTRCYFTIDKQDMAVYHKGKKLEGIDAVIPRIGASVTYFGTLVVHQFEKMNVFVVNPSQAILNSRDKLKSLQILTQAGLNVPRTAFACNMEDISQTIDLVGGPPLVIKLLEGTQGIGVMLADTRQSAESAMEAFYGLESNVLIQQFIKEAKGLDIRAFVVNGEVIGAMVRKAKEGEFRSNLHRGGKATLTELNIEEQEAAIMAAKCLGLNVAGVDMLRSAVGPMILEVNSTPGLEGIEGATGVDIAGKIVAFAAENAKR